MVLCSLFCKREKDEEQWRLHLFLRAECLSCLLCGVFDLSGKAEVPGRLGAALVAYPNPLLLLSIAEVHAAS